MRLPAGARVRQPHRLHRPEPQRLPSPPRHFLDRQAPLEVRNLVELVALVLIGGEEGIEKRLVARAVERGIEVVVPPALSVPRQGIEAGMIERVVGDDRRDRVVERERLGAQTSRDGGGESARR